jgi:hypothetical protein
MSISVFNRLYTNAAFCFDLLKTRAQNNKQNRMSYRHEIRRIMKSEGLYGFTRGYTAMYLRDGPGFALYFCLFDIMKRTFGVPAHENPNEVFQAHVALKKFFAGGISGMMVWTTCYPFDTVKSMM